MTRGQVPYSSADDVQAIFGLGIDESDVAGAEPVADAHVLATVVLFDYLAADSADVNNSETLVDSGLQVTLTAGIWRIEANLAITTEANADIDLKFTGTATVTEDNFHSHLAGARIEWDTEWSNPGGAVADILGYGFVGILVVTVAGTAKIQFAQGTADISNTHIDAGSLLTAVRVGEVS